MLLLVSWVTQSVFKVTLSIGGWHNMGTARMGLDPATSVVNEWGRAHEVRNLFVIDGSIFTTAAGRFTYHVTSTQIVTPNDLWITNPTDTPTATLFACHPLGSTAKRIVVSLALAT